jgi:hypothetical protein
MKIARRCAKYFLEALEFYSHYNPDLKVSMIGLDIEPDYSGIFLALHHEYSLKHIELGTGDWDEPTLVRFDIGNGSKIRSLNDNVLEGNFKSIVIEIFDAMISGFNNINSGSKVLFSYNLHEGDFNIIRERDFANNFQIDEEIVQRGLENASKEENCPEREVLLNMDIAIAPQRVFADIENIFTRSLTWLGFVY